MNDSHPGLLVLEDGSSYVGQSLAAEGEWVGEIVFNTSMTGYQEIITDPSYWGQMVVFTCPHIGNVGINTQDVESRQPFVRAVIARQICAPPSNWRATSSLTEYLSNSGVPALSGIDTRRLTLTLREKGALRAAISTLDMDTIRLVEIARSAPDMSSLDPANQVTELKMQEWAESVPEQWNADMRPDNRNKPHVVVIDCGIKRNILRNLVAVGAHVTVVPSNAGSESVMALAPDGVLVGNGPGDPTCWPQTIATVRDLIGRVPLFGLCLGHQLIALAFGALTYKLPFGHHGANHPVQALEGGIVEITSQNHNYAVDAKTLTNLSLEVTQRNLYDGTVEGMRSEAYHITTIQYHPEASPGPHDSLHLLREFVRSLKTTP
jgi:carbamoyl-phosphate synthase small subunit